VAEITKNDGKWLISGDLLLDDIESLLAHHVVAGSKNLEVDMSGVSEVDSTTISLLFEWLRQARGSKCELVYTNLPANLTSLASLYGVLNLIPQAADQAVSH
jgi:phospholipid transport system transporter-binding protein